jgi:predicted lipid-binding transport protein (Tim44 family)
MTLSSGENLTNPRSDIQAEHRVETLVSEVASVIRSAEPERRGELKELAETLLHDEISSIQDKAPAAQTPAAAPRLNPLLPGILLTLLGFGFFLLFPLVGFALAGIGTALMIWGAVLSWLRK